MHQQWRDEGFGAQSHYGNNLELITGGGMTIEGLTTASSMAADREPDADFDQHHCRDRVLFRLLTVTTSGTGALSITTAHSLVLNSGSSLLTHNGGIRIAANVDGTSPRSSFRGHQPARVDSRPPGPETSTSRRTGWPAAAWDTSRTTGSSVLCPRRTLQTRERSRSAGPEAAPARASPITASNGVDTVLSRSGDIVLVGQGGTTPGSGTSTDGILLAGVRTIVAENNASIVSLERLAGSRRRRPDMA